MGEGGGGLLEGLNWWIKIFIYILAGLHLIAFVAYGFYVALDLRKSPEQRMVEEVRRVQEAQKKQA